MTILVCGSRYWKDADTIDRVLSEYLDQMTVLVHGACLGADLLAAAWARNGPWKGQVRAYPADWATYGNLGGPIRNSWMLRDARPELVIAFHPNLEKLNRGGTLDMVRKARAAGVPVRVVTGQEETP